MTYADLKHSISCITSAGVGIAGGLLIVALVCGGFYGLLLGFEWMAKSIPDNQLGGAFSIVLLGALLCAVAVFAVFALSEIVIGLCVVAIPLVVAMALTQNTDITFGIVMALLAVVGLISIMTTCNAVISPFNRRRNDLTHRQDPLWKNYTVTVKERFASIGDYASEYLIVFLLLMTWGILGTAFSTLVSQPAHTNWTPAQWGAWSVVIVILIHAVFSISSGLIWSKLDKNVSDVARIISVLIMSIVPIACALMALHVFGTGLSFMLGLAAGCMSYSLLGGIFKCEENLWEILRRKMAKPVQATPASQNDSDGG